MIKKTFENGQIIPEELREPVMLHGPFIACMHGREWINQSRDKGIGVDNDPPIGKSFTLTHFGRPNRSVPYLDDDPPPETLGDIVRDELARLGLKLSKGKVKPPAMPADIPQWLRRKD